MLSDFFQILRKVNSRKADIVRTLANDSKRSFWAIADQGVASVGNFGINFLLGWYFLRHADPISFANFGILIEPMIFLNGLQAALFVFPLSVRGSAGGRALGSLTGMSILLTLGLWPFLALALVVTALIANISLLAGIWAAIAMLMWQIQETLRKSLIAELRFRDVIWGDIISYPGQIVVVGLFAYTEHLNLVSTFEAMSATSALAAAVQAYQLRVKDVSLAQVRGWAVECWGVGRWMMLGNAWTLLTGPVFAWNIAYWAGKEILAINNALANLLRLVNPLSVAISTLILPSVARVRQELGMLSAMKVMVRFGIIGACLLTPYLGLIFLAPGWSIALLYHDNLQLIGFTFILQVMVIMASINYLSVVTGTFLNAVEKSRWTFLAQMLAAGVTILIAVPLTAQFSLLGAALGAALASAAQLAAHLYFIRRLDAEPMTVPVRDPDDDDDALPAAPTTHEPVSIRIA